MRSRRVQHTAVSSPAAATVAGKQRQFYAEPMFWRIVALLLLLQLASALLPSHECPQRAPRTRYPHRPALAYLTGGESAESGIVGTGAGGPRAEPNRSPSVTTGHQTG